MCADPVPRPGFRPAFLVLPTFLLILLPALPLYADDPQVFGSFEDQAQVAAVNVSNGVHIQRSTKFPAWEGNSLQVVYPAGGGSMETSKLPADWRRQQSLLAFIWSMQPGEAKLMVRDAAGGTVSRAFRLRAGANHLQWPLTSMAGLDLSAVRSIRFESAREGTWYVDYIALDRYHPVLEQRGRWDINYSMEVETPHVPWARPFADGPIRVYAIADVADGRGIVELAQRLEMTFKATTIGSSPGTNKWGFGDFYEQRSSGGEFWKNAYSLAHTYIADDLIHGPKYDVILWPGLRPWDSYPEEVRDAVRRRVEEGTGLVLFYPFNKDGKPIAAWTPSPLLRAPDIKSEDSNNFFRNRFEDLDHSAWKPTADHYITRGIPFALLPFDQMAVPASKTAGELLLQTSAGNPVLAVHTVGKGRVAAFAYSEKGMIPEIHNVFETGLHYPYHEYLWSLVARATIWAAHREPEPAIRDTACTASGVEGRVEALPTGAQLAVTVRNSFGEVEATGLASAKAASRNLAFAFPALQGGRHMVELRLLKGGLVLDWAVSPLDVPAKVTIQSLLPGTDRVKAGEDVPVSVQLSGGAATVAEIRIRMFDNYGRLLDEHQSKASLPAEARQAFVLKTTGALTHLARVDCEVQAGGLRADRRTADVFVLQPRKWDDYDVVMYRFGPDPIPGIWPKIDEQLRRLQVTTLSSYSVNHSKHANYSVQAQTRISGQESPDGPARDYYTAMKKKYLETGDKHVLIRQFVLDDPGYRELISKELKRLTEAWVPFSPMSYYILEEPSLTCYGDAVDICFSPFTLQGMRKWLRDIYGTLEKLNRQWGTSFAGWEAVEPDDAPEAQKRGNYASWADHRTYMEKTYAETLGFVFGELRKIDPEGIILNSGTQISGSHNAADYSRLNRYTKHLNAYDGGNQLDFHRNFAASLKISGGSGYGVLGKDVFYNLYDGLFKGCNGGAYIFWQYSTIDADLTMSQSGKDMEQGLAELRGEGIGKLVGLALPDNHGIAIHYSYPSIHGAWIADGKIKEQVSYNTSPTFNRFNENRDGWVKILKDSGFQFDFIAYSAVEAGELLSRGYKTFVLPMSVALSDREVGAIQDFVRQGGTVIADALPGIMDEHCTFRSVRPLQEVFGITAVPGTREALLKAAGDPGVHAVAAKALARQGDTPLLLSNTFGRGRAYLLNHFLYDYPAEKEEGRGAVQVDRLSLVLQDAGLRPKVTISNPGGERVTECSRYLFNLGTTRLLGLVPDKSLPEARKVRIRLDGQGTVYDVRGKKIAGSGDQFEVAIEPAVPQLYAVVAEPVRAVEISGPAASKRGEEIQVTLTAATGSAYRSVAKVQVLNPAGKVCTYYGRNVDIVDGKGVFCFRTALNDPSGLWKILVNDVISGRTATAEVRLQ